MNPYNEALECYEEAEREIQEKHYHLVVGKLQYALFLLESSNIVVDLIGNIYLQLCKAYFYLKNEDKVLDFSQKGITFYQNKNEINLCPFYRYKAVLLAQEGMYDQAMNINMSILNIAEKHAKSNNELKGSTYFNLGNCYLNLSNYTMAKRCYIRAYNYIGNTRQNLKGKILMGIGYIYHKTEKLDLAYKCYRKAQDYVVYSEDMVAFGRLAHNLGEIFLSLNEKDISREYFFESIKTEIYFKLDRVRSASSLRGLACTYIGEDLELVHKYCLKALNVLLSGMSIKLKPHGEKELGQIFLLLSYCLFYKIKRDEFKIYLVQANKILNKYNMKGENDKLEAFRKQNTIWRR